MGPRNVLYFDSGTTFPYLTVPKHRDCILYTKMHTLQVSQFGRMPKFTLQCFHPRCLESWQEYGGDRTSAHGVGMTPGNPRPLPITWCTRTQCFYTPLVGSAVRLPRGCAVTLDSTYVRLLVGVLTRVNLESSH